MPFNSHNFRHTGTVVLNKTLLTSANNNLNNWHVKTILKRCFKGWSPYLSAMSLKTTYYNPILTTKVTHLRPWWSLLLCDIVTSTLVDVVCNTHHQIVCYSQTVSRWFCSILATELLNFDKMCFMIKGLKWLTSLRDLQLTNNKLISTNNIIITTLLRQHLTAYRKYRS